MSLFLYLAHSETEACEGQLERKKERKPEAEFLRQYWTIDICAHSPSTESIKFASYTVLRFYCNLCPGKDYLSASQ